MFLQQSDRHRGGRKQQLDVSCSEPRLAKLASSFFNCVLLCYRISSTLGSKMHKKSSSSQRDDIHVCIMCLRAIMNYQVEFANATGVKNNSKKILKGPLGDILKGLVGVK